MEQPVCAPRSFRRQRLPGDELKKFCRVLSHALRLHVCPLRGGMGYAGVALLLSLAVLCSVPALGRVSAAAQAQSDEEKNVAFRWAFGAMVGTANERKLEAITQDTTLRTGDQLKMFVELKKQCFVYVFYQSAQGELRMLFPCNLEQFAADYQVGKKYLIPQGDAWFELDQNVGTETFFLLASSERLQQLEDLFTQYESAETEKKAEVGEQALAEIRNLRKQHRELTAPAERPVAIGGAIRGVEVPQGTAPPDIAALAEDFSAVGFYGRTFTIEHQ